MHLPEGRDGLSDRTRPENVGLLLSLASARGVAAANVALRPMDLSTRAYSLLEKLDESPGLSQRELADALRLDPSQIVALVDLLEGRGLVERRPNPRDRRQRCVVATDTGRTTYRRARTVVDASVDQLLGDLSPSERSAFYTLLHRIARPAQEVLHRVS